MVAWGSARLAGLLSTNRKWPPLVPYSQRCATLPRNRASGLTRAGPSARIGSRWPGGTVRVAPVWHPNLPALGRAFESARAGQGARFGLRRAVRPDWLELGGAVELTRASLCSQIGSCLSNRAGGPGCPAGWVCVRGAREASCYGCWRPNSTNPARNPSLSTNAVDCVAEIWGRGDNLNEQGWRAHESRRLRSRGLVASRFVHESCRLRIEAEGADKCLSRRSRFVRESGRLRSRGLVASWFVQESRRLRGGGYRFGPSCPLPRYPHIQSTEEAQVDGLPHSQRPSLCLGFG